LLKKLAGESDALCAGIVNFGSENNLLITLDNTMDRKGKLYFRYGTMGSAKTALLLTQAYNFEERKMTYVCMKPIVDTREKDNVIRSRIGIERKCEWIYGETDIYLMARDFFEKTGAVIDWILVDEAQFLSADQVDQLARIVDDYGSNVICYGLRTDFRTHLFEGSRRLFEIADTIDEIKSTCSCGRKTIVNARIDSNGDFVNEGQQVEIGGDDRYIAVCRKCWRNNRIEQAARHTLPLD
jgi:thymidine kinase